MSRFILAFLLIPSFAFAQTSPSAGGAKRPMTFEDMMAMKRLGDTAVSPDGKWLAYAVTTVDLNQNTKTTEWWFQKIDGGDPLKVAVAQPGDSGIQFSSDGHSVLFLSGRKGGQQIWLADFDPASGATSNARKLTSISTEADNAKWSPDSKFIVFTSAVYPDCSAITPTDSSGDRCNADKDARAASTKVKAQIFTHLLYRHWNHYTGDTRSHLFLVDVATGAIRDLTPNDSRDVPPEYPTEPLGCGCAISPDSKELAFTENLDPVPAISTNADIFTLDLTNPVAKPVKVSTSPGGDFNPAYSPDGKYLAWRSQARASYEADKFRLLLYDREKKTIKILLPNMDQWVDEFTWSPDSKRLYFTSGFQGAEPIYSLGVDANKFCILTLGNGEFSGPAVSGDGRTLIASGMHVWQPSEVYALNSAADLRRPQLEHQFTVNGPIKQLIALRLEEFAIHPPQRRPPRPTRPPKMEDLLVHRRRQDQAPRLPHPSARTSTPPRNTRSSSSSTAARRAHGAMPGATAGTPNSLPPTATSSS